MWGIEFYDEAAKNRRSVKPISPKSDESTPTNLKPEINDTDQNASQETGTEELPSESRSGPDSSPTRGNALVDQSPQSNQSVVTSEQAESRPELPNETLEEKLGDHVTPAAAEDAGTTDGVENKRHVAPNLRHESIDEDYVIITHKTNRENEDLPEPGTVAFLRHKNRFEFCCVLFLC